MPVLFCFGCCAEGWRPLGEAGDPGLRTSCNETAFGRHKETSNRAPGRPRV